MRTAGGETALFIRAVLTMPTSPFSWRKEFAVQFVTVVKSCLLPLALVNVIFMTAVEAGTLLNFLSAVGALDRTGFGTAIAIRELAVFISASVVAGIAGTAMTADLGARRIREEIDALEVLGVEPVRNLVVPRVLALVVASFAFVPVVMVSITLGAFVSVTYLFDAPTGPFVPQLFGNMNVLDVYSNSLRAMLFGAIIGVICCYKGMNASGGAEGVGRAVNQAVVSCLLVIFAANVLYSQVYLALFPDSVVIR